MPEFNLETEPADVREWFDSRPPHVQQRIREYPPGGFYWLKSSGHVVRLYCYSEDEETQTCDTCQVVVLQEHNPHKLLAFDRRVFGIPFDDLEPLSDDEQERIGQIAERSPDFSAE